MMLFTSAQWVDVTAAVLVFLSFLFLRKIFTLYIFKIILKLAHRSSTDLDDIFLLAFEAPLRSLFIILGLYFAFTILPLTPVQNILLLKILRVALILLVTWGLYNLAGTSLSEATATKLNFKIDRILVPFFNKVIKVVIIALALSIIAQELGYEISGLIAGLGLGGLAVALAAQDAIANIFGGIVIITDKPFTIGDWIATPSVEGTVEDITFRSTKIRAFAQALVSVPNKKLADEPITNWTRMGKRRIDFYLGVAYTTPVAKLKKCVQLIRELLESHPGVHKETIFVYFNRFGESSLDIFLYFFTVTTNWGEYLKIREEINFKILEILENEGVSIALPSRRLFMETPPPLNSGEQEQEQEQEQE
ncbi:MAG: mechanosensitive ion channel family protein [Firmicutes bacterium]|nr:mechanosensitive ion channel family protein [Bacillota bacterium]